MSQLTCYYYSFMILTAPLFGFAALTQLVWIASFYDDKYTGLTAISLVFCYGLSWIFWPRTKPVSVPDEAVHATPYR